MILLLDGGGTVTSRTLELATFRCDADLEDGEEETWGFFDGYEDYIDTQHDWKDYADF